MKAHEYQAREMLQAAGVPVPASKVIDRAEQAGEAFRSIGTSTVITV